MSGSSQFKRLSKDVIPSNYELKITTDTENEVFLGTVKINVMINSRVSEIFLHSIDLNITEAKIEQDADEYIAAVQVDEALEGIILKFEDQLSEGRATLTVRYDGKLNENMKGYYKTTYTHNGETIKCAATQFEPADARRALPCFDEPDVKATFNVTLVARADQTVLSNMEIDYSEPFTNERGGNLMITRFKQTPIMSTYLLAFIVGRYDYVEGFDANGVRVRIYTSIGRSEEGRFALNIALKALSYYADFFDYRYALPKCDMIALADFAMGAMENWGLVTYRETALLATDTSSISVKQRVAIVVAHELAHMWFGNLVTMDWWTYLWLNEGFATWISYLCVDHIFPEYDIWTQFQISEISVAMSLDSLKTSHPIEVRVGPPSEVEEIFDRISYSKGSSVIGYLYHFMGEEYFRDGLRRYLKRHAFGNTTTSDLWSALTEASGIDVASVMNNWVTCQGFPYLTITPCELNEDGLMQYTVEQHSCSKSSDDSIIWTIPYNLVHQSSPECPVKLFLNERQMTIGLATNPTDWIKLNFGNNGFYRVKYGGTLKDSIIAAVNGSLLGVSEKIGIANDFLSLACIGQMSLVDGLQLCWSLRKETDFNVWQSIWSIISTVDTLFQTTSSYPYFVKFVTRLIESPYNFVGWTPTEGEDSSVSLLRTLIFSAMVRFGNDDFNEKCRLLFDGIAKGIPVHADIQSSVFRSVLLCSSIGFDILNKLIDYYSNSSLSEERVRILISMGYSTNIEVIQKVLEFSESDSVRSQDYPILISGLSSLKSNIPILWDYLKSNYTALSQRFVAFGLISRVVMSVTSHFDSQQAIEDIKTFFASVDASSIDRCVKQCIEKAEVRNCLFNDNYSDINQYLSTFS